MLLWPSLGLLGLGRSEGGWGVGLCGEGGFGLRVSFCNQ